MCLFYSAVGEGNCSAMFKKKSREFQRFPIERLCELMEADFKFYHSDKLLSPLQLNECLTLSKYYLADVDEFTLQILMDHMCT